MLSLQPVVPFEISRVRVYTMDFETTSHASQLSALGNTIQSGNRATHTNSKILKTTELFETVQQRKEKLLNETVEQKTERLKKRRRKLFGCSTCLTVAQRFSSSPICQIHRNQLITFFFYSYTVDFPKAVINCKPLLFQYHS